MKKTVLFCVSPNCGGAERVTLTIAKLLDLNKFDIKIVIIGKSKGEIVDFIPDYFDIIHVKTRNIWDFTICKLVNLFRKIHPDIVFCSLMYLSTRVIVAAKIVDNIKIIIRNNNSISTLRYDYMFLVKKLYRYATEIILQTDEMKVEMIKYLNLEDNKLHVIFNPIDIELINRNLKQATTPFDSMYINYVFVGRIDYCKGLDILISSFASLLKDTPQCRLYIVGKTANSNSYYLRLKQQIEDLGMKDSVIWTGFTTNPYQYIKYADCFVLPSRIEGLPNVLLDAMFLKVPVVATRSVPVIDRIVQPQRGIVVEVEDISSLKNAMLKAVELNIKDDYYEDSKEELLNLFI